MEMVYRKKYQILDNCTDRYGSVKPSQILFFAQDAATSHCKELGMDWDSMAARGLFWAVTRTKVEITRMPKPGEEVTVETWPMKTTRVAYPRAMEMYDSQGNLLLRTVSLWVLMDLEKRSMVLPGKSGLDFSGEDRGTELKPPAGLAAFPADRSRTRTVAYTDLDINGHLNNARYMDWVEDLTDSGFHRERMLREMTVCYLSEAREGQTLDLGWTHDRDSETLSVDFRRGNERVFAAKMTYGVL